MYSIVILSKNVANLRACVAAVQANEPTLPSESIIVVDDDETNEIRKFCSVEELTRVAGEKPFVFAKNANKGLRLAFRNSDAAILLNDDALLQTRRGFTELYKASALNFSRFGLLASSCNNVGNENQHPQRIFDRGGYQIPIRREHRMLCFVCVIIPRDVWGKVGPLDERFFQYGLDDDDYSLRVRQAGYRLGVFDGCYCDHGSLTSTFRGAAGAGGDFSGNLEIFKQKWGFDNWGQPV